MQKPKTYFEQVPIEVVRRIAEKEQLKKEEKENAKKKETARAHVAFETSATKTEPYSVRPEHRW